MIVVVIVIAKKVMVEITSVVIVELRNIPS